MMDLPPASVVSLEAVEQLRNDIADLFIVYDTTLDQPQHGYVRFRGQFIIDPADCFDELRMRFERHGFTPMIRHDTERVAVIGLPVVFNPPESNWIFNLALFILTIASTLWVGANFPSTLMETLTDGWPFSLSIMLILGAHELGHYFAARYHKVPVTLPYFIPMPLSIIGTMGAFIRLKSPVKNRRALLDVGVAGPIAGMVFALPILIYGLSISEIGPLPQVGSYFLEGNSILYALLKVMIFGEFLPSNGMDVTLSPVAWAGWVGFLVTGLNLIPLGQLDGGHIAYVLFGKRAKQLFWPIIVGLVGLALITGATTWYFWVAMLYFLGRRHAEPLDDVTELDPRRRAVAIFALITFLLVFVPTPLQIMGG